MHRSLFISLLAVSFLAACADAGSRHKANVFGAGQINQRQEVKTVTIIDIQPARIEVLNQRNQEIAEGVGFVLGAVLGAAVGDDIDRGTQSAVIGGAIGAEAGKLGGGRKKLVDGVQIIYREGDRVLQSAQVGSPCEYAPGPALVTVTGEKETRIQSNHDCVSGQEQIVGTVSKLQGLANIQDDDQDTLDSLDRQNAVTIKRRQVQTNR